MVTTVSDWVPVAIFALIVIYKLGERWLDNRSEQPGEHRATYSDTTPAYRDPAQDDGERRIPDIQVGFRKEER